jgi:hypothetical protein
VVHSCGWQTVFKKSAVDFSIIFKNEKNIGKTLAFGRDLLLLIKSSHFSNHI